MLELAQAIYFFVCIVITKEGGGRSVNPPGSAWRQHKGGEKSVTSPLSSREASCLIPPLVTLFFLKISWLNSSSGIAAGSVFFTFYYACCRMHPVESLAGMALRAGRSTLTRRIPVL